ncbi:MAG: hypothetical protein J2P54_24610 [Bradyrhizobiaceae bacterium]|nr:hypothetical protein [Bradyrhizobiaceae bacterium]
MQHLSFQHRDIQGWDSAAQHTSPRDDCHNDNDARGNRDNACRDYGDAGNHDDACHDYGHAGNHDDACRDHNGARSRRDNAWHDYAWHDYADDAGNHDDVCRDHNGSRSHGDDAGCSCDEVSRHDHDRATARYELAKINKCSSALGSMERINKTEPRRVRERLCKLSQRRFRDWQAA